MVITTGPDYIHISIANQNLVYRQARQILFECAVSTAANGAGEYLGSECTPRGWHYIRARIGGDQAVNTVFKARRPTGEIYTAGMREQFPHRDWILTRILWLCGLEPGFNRLGYVDTMRRYIYIHGCPDEDDFTHPGSHGCIKLHNTDMLALFDKARLGTSVLITES